MPVISSNTKAVALLVAWAPLLVSAAHPGHGSSQVMSWSSGHHIVVIGALVLVAVAVSSSGRTSTSKLVLLR